MNNLEVQKTVKAITNCPEINFTFLDHTENFFDINKDNLLDITSLNFPKNQLDDDIKAYADLSCCYHLFHDQRLDKKIKKQFQLSSGENKFFNSLEKTRISLISRQYYIGIFKNILTKFEKDFNMIANDDRSAILQILLIGKYLDNNQIIVSNNLEEIYFQTNQNIKESILDKINELTAKIENQSKFSNISYDLIKLIGQEELTKKEKQKKQKGQGKQKNNSKEKQDNEAFQKDTQESQGTQEEEPIQEIVRKEEQSSTIETECSGQSETKQSPKESFPTEEKGLEFYCPYKIYSSAFDQVIIPSKLIEKDELFRLKTLLDSKIDKLDNISRKLRLEFRKKLISKQNIAIRQSQDDEIIDRKKLTQIIASPFKKNFYITNKNQQYQNTVITILLDNSGSMRGSPIVISAMACQIIAQLLEEFSIKTEILGFTTADWRGGKSKKLWEENGNPKDPGRLNDLRHIIYKSANQTFKKSKVNLGFKGIFWFFFVRFFRNWLHG